MWLFRRKKSLSDSEKVLSLCISKERSLELLCILKQVSKRIFAEVDVILNDFYDIPYMRVNEKLSERQYELLVENAKHILDHSSWFISCALHHCIDVLSTRDSHRLACNYLACPPGCSRKLSVLSRLPLLTINKVAPLTKDKILKSEQLEPFLHYLVPWMMMEIDIDTSSFYSILTKKDITCIYYFLREMSSFYPRANTILNNILKTITPSHYEVLRECETAIIPIKKILNGEIDANLTFEQIQAINSTTVIPYDIVKIQMMHSSPEQEELFMEIVTTDNISLFVDSNALKYYIVTNCINLLLELIESPYKFPPFIPISLTQGVYYLSSDTVFVLEDLYKKYNSVKQLALFTVICYLFGIEHNTLAISRNMFYPLTYGELYSSDTLSVAEIIYYLGGRRLGEFDAYINECLILLHKLRKHYYLVMNYMDVLKVKHTLVDSRFNPRLIDSQASRIFMDVVNKNANKTIGWWKYIGY